MPDDDRAYLSKRLDAEQYFARTSPCAEAAVIHQDMADAYRLCLQSLVETNREQRMYWSTAGASAAMHRVIGSAYQNRAVQRPKQGDPA